METKEYRNLNEFNKCDIFTVPSIIEFLDNKPIINPKNIKHFFYDNILGYIMDEKYEDDLCLCRLIIKKI